MNRLSSCLLVTLLACAGGQAGTVERTEIKPKAEPVAELVAPTVFSLLAQGEDARQSETVKRSEPKAEGEVVAQISVSGDPLTDLAVGPHGKLLAAAQAGLVSILDAKTMTIKAQHRFLVRMDDEVSLQFDSSGSRLMVFAYSGLFRVLVWDLHTNQISTTYSDTVYKRGMSSDGTTLCSQTGQNRRSRRSKPRDKPLSVHLHHLLTKQDSVSVVLPKEVAGVLKCTPNINKKKALVHLRIDTGEGAFKKEYRLVDFQTGATSQLGGVTALQRPNGRSIAVVNKDGVSFLDPKNAKVIGTKSIAFEEEMTERNVHTSWSANGRFFVLVANSNQIAIIDAEQDRVLRADFNGKLRFRGLTNQSLFVRVMKKGEKTVTKKVALSDATVSTPVEAPRFPMYSSNDGEQVIVDDHDSLSRFTKDKVEKLPALPSSPGREKSIWGIEPVPDGRVLMWGRGGAAILGAEAHALNCFGEGFLSPDSKRFVTPYRSCPLNGDKAKQLKPSTSTLAGRSPNGRFAVSIDEGRASLFDLQKNKVVRKLVKGDIYCEEEGGDEIYCGFAVVTNSGKKAAVLNDTNLFISSKGKKQRKVRIKGYRIWNTTAEDRFFTADATKIEIRDWKGNHISVVDLGANYNVQQSDDKSMFSAVTKEELSFFDKEGTLLSKTPIDGKGRVRLPGAGTFAILQSNNTSVLWDIAGSREVLKLGGGEFDLSKDERSLLACDFDGQMSLITVADKSAKKLGSCAAAKAVLLSEDGKYAVYQTSTAMVFIRIRDQERMTFRVFRGAKTSLFASWGKEVETDYPLEYLMIREDGSLVDAKMTTVEKSTSGLIARFFQ